MNFHCFTAVMADAANSGATCALNTRTDSTLPSTPMIASIGTTPSRPASRIASG